APSEPAPEETTPVAAESVPEERTNGADTSRADDATEAALEVPVELIAESNAVPAVELAPEPPTPEPAAPKRSGWWRRNK
ncbi:MAG: hypothetical protein V7703_16185, partial [Hyphomicrobiales bacterium]